MDTDYALYGEGKIQLKKFENLRKRHVENMNPKNKFVITVDVEYPPQFDAETVARIMTDYMNLNRFVIGQPIIHVFATNDEINLNVIYGAEDKAPSVN